jgi:hypothetical protein
VELAVNERNAAFKVWNDNINKVIGDRLWILYVQKRRYADGLVERIWTLVFLNGSFTRTCVDWGLSKPLRDFKLRWMLSV